MSPAVPARALPLLALAFALSGLGATAAAQEPGPLDLNEGLVFSRTPTGNEETPWRNRVDFWPKAGRTYVIEETEDLTNLVWRRLPGIMLGYEGECYVTEPDGYTHASVPAGYREFDSNTDRHFARLRYVDNLIEPFWGDHDRDGVSNYDEVTHYQTAPFGYPDEDAADSDSDGLPDAWERWRFGSLEHGAADVGAAGRTYAELYAAQRRDADDDGLPDDWEKFRCGGTLAEGPSTVRDGKTNLARHREDRVKLSEHRFGAQVFRYDPTFIGNAFAPDPLNPLEVRFRGNQGGSMIVWYSEGYAEIVNVRVWPSNGFYGSVRPDVDDPAVHHADYTGSVVDGVYDYVFSATPATGEFVARDLLRSLDGHPLRRTESAGATHLRFAPLAITSRPLLEARPDVFPVVLRDFPYYDSAHRTFPDFGSYFGPTENVSGPELEGGPLRGLPAPQLAVLGQNSGQALRQWFTWTDAFAFGLPAATDTPGWQGIKALEDFFPHRNDVGSSVGDIRNRHAFTVELHARLDYSRGPEVDDPESAFTALTAGSDDVCTVFIDGRKVIDIGGGSLNTYSIENLRDMVKLRDGEATSFLEAPAGTCVVDLFFADRLYGQAALTLLARGALKPIYVYQVVVDSDLPTALTYALTQKPAGMEIDAKTGKILWDYYGLNVDADPENDVASGAYAVTVEVADTRGHSASQTFTLTLTL